MIQKTAALVAIAAATGVAVTVAQASALKSHNVHQTGEGSGIYHNATGSADTFAGTLGTNGAIIEKRAHKAGSQTTFGGTATVFGPQGSYSGTITKGTCAGCGEAGPPSKETANVKITAGAGLYKGATGSVTITDTYISGSAGFFTIVVSGTIKY